MQFKINLATRTYINKKKVNSTIAAAIMVLLFLFLVQIKIYSRNAGEISRISSLKTADDAGFKKKVPGFTEKDYVKLTNDIKFCNSLIEKKTYDWVGLLNRLESVVPDGLTLTSLEPDSEEHTLKLTGNSLNFGVMRHFMENLEASDFFSNVYLYKQDEKETKENQKLLSFTISCKYKL
jgi:type IV pilus assembly protein PilN